VKHNLLVTISLDGDKWCCLVGENLQEGLAGFGDSPCDALRALADEIEVNQWNLGDITLW
jgi:hypothetical protein